MIGRWMVAMALGGTVLAVEPATFRLPTPIRFIPEQPAASEASRIHAHPETAPAERWEFTDRIALILEPNISPDAFLKDRSVTWLRSPAPDIHILQAAHASAAWDLASEWSGLPGVRAVYPVVHPPWSALDAYAPAPDDEFFRAQVANVEGQWYLENRDPETGARLGVDLNLRSAWALSRGAGMTVGVADTGVQLEHPDLAANLQGAPHFNFDTRLLDGQPVLSGSRGAHGTSVAGLIAATTDNALGMSGVAPEARVASWVIWTP
ncbi:MAG: S8 family serine peptidase, partial [Verrucomicrobiae bacterium]|nr:S8 family serine peptidase [Verrucomicrobiae bacterium]